MKNEIVLFRSQDGAVSLPVSVEADTVWLTQAQMAQLFGRSQPVIARHIKNAFDDLPCPRWRDHNREPAEA